MKYSYKYDIKKKVMAVLLSTGLLLTGCAGSGNSDSAGLDSSAEEQSTEDQNVSPDGASSLITEEVSEDLIVVGLAQVGSESDWRLTNTASYRSTFTEENGYYLIFADGQQKQENQVKAIRNFILQDVDYIILDPIVETGWDSVLEEAKEAGIPVILADRTISVSNPSLYTTWVGSNFYQEGVDAGNWLQQYLESEGRNDEQINIVTLQGTIGSTAQIGRTEGFAEVAEENSNWNMLEQLTGDFTQAKGKEVMQYFLETYPNIDVIISENDNMTFGAIDAMKEAGIEVDAEDGPVIISFDAVKDALLAVKNREIDAEFECNPLTGPYIDDIIRKLEKGETVERTTYVDETYFDHTMDLDALMKERDY